MKRKVLQLPWQAAEALEVVRAMVQKKADEGKLLVPINDHDNRVTYGTVIELLCRNYVKESKRKR